MYVSKKKSEENVYCLRRSNVNNATLVVLILVLHGRSLRNSSTEKFGKNV